MNPSLEQAIEMIERDKSSGAAQLAAMGLDLMAEASTLAAESGPVEGLAEIRAMVRRIDRLRPSMAAPGNWALIFYCDLRERVNSAPGTRLNEAGPDIAASLKVRLASHAGRMAESAKSLLEGAGCVMTLSYSSSVEAVLKSAAPANCRIIVAESRPLLEGRKMIDRLRESGLDARCITDAAVGLHMEEADFLLIGADTICRDGAAVNKTGSLPAALTAHRFGKPCAAFADTFKISGRLSAGEVKLEKGPGNEVWPEGAEFSENTTFEPVPPDLITFYVTEKGLWAHHLIRDEAARWRRLWESFESGRGEQRQS